MKHRIITKQPLGNHNSIIIVQLQPECILERNAIKNVEVLIATEKETELIENYLNFKLDLGDYSIIKLISQKNDLFEIEIFI